MDVGFAYHNMLQRCGNCVSCIQLMLRNISLTSAQRNTNLMVLGVVVLGLVVTGIVHAIEGGREVLCKLGVHLLITTHAAYSLVLLTANIEDVRKIARKFVSASVAEQLTQFIAEASVIKSSNISAENIQNEKKNLDREWNTYHNPPKDSYSSSDERIKIIKGNSNRDSVNKDSSVSYESRNEEKATGSIYFHKGKHRDIDLNKPKKEKDFVYKYGLKQENLKTPKFEWKKAENFDFLSSYNTKNYLSNPNPYLYNSLTFPIEDKGNLETGNDTEIYSFDKNDRTLGSPYERPQINIEPSIKEINISAENSLEMDAPKYTTMGKTGSTKFYNFYSIFKTTETQTEDNNLINNSNNSKDDISATSERTQPLRPSTKLIDSSEGNLLNDENKNYLQTHERDTNYELDFRNHLKRIINEINDEESRRIQYRATDGLKNDKNITELKSNDKELVLDTNVSDMENDDEYELLSKKYNFSEIDTEEDFENNNLGKVTKDVSRKENQKRILIKGNKEIREQDIDLEKLIE